MEKLKEIGAALFSLASFAFIIVLAVIFIKGAVWVSVTILPWITILNGFTILIGLFILLPLALIKYTRIVGATALFAASYIYGATLCIWGCVISYAIWGLTGLIIGLLIAGIGVVPIAMLACAVKGLWSLLLQLMILLAITYGSRILALYLVEKTSDAASGEVISPDKTFLAEHSTPSPDNKPIYRPEWKLLDSVAAMIICENYFILDYIPYCEDNYRDAVGDSHDESAVTDEEFRVLFDDFIQSYFTVVDRTNDYLKVIDSLREKHGIPVVSLYSYLKYRGNSAIALARDYGRVANATVWF